MKPASVVLRDRNSFLNKKAPSNLPNEVAWSSSGGHYNREGPVGTSRIPGSGGPQSKDLLAIGKYESRRNTIIVRAHAYKKSCTYLKKQHDILL